MDPCVSVLDFRAKVETPAVRKHPEARLTCNHQANDKSIAQTKAVQLSLDLWKCEDGEIRMTPDGQPSVFDMIRVLGGRKNPSQVWKDILRNYPEAIQKTDEFKFKGRGQQMTPWLVETSEIRVFVATPKIPVILLKAKEGAIQTPPRVTTIYIVAASLPV